VKVLPTFTVEWTRPGETEVFVCTKLTATRLLRRLVGAVANFGEVTIVGIRREEL
jgi:hypothetical protein